MGKTLFQEKHPDRWGKGNICTRICEHNVITIRDFKQTRACKTCNKKARADEAFYVPDTTEFFNTGLGCFTSGTRHAEKIARKRGLVPAGDSNLKTVYRQYFPNHPLTKGFEE